MYVYKHKDKPPRVCLPDPGVSWLQVISDKVLLDVPNTGNGSQSVTYSFIYLFVQLAKSLGFTSET